MTTKPTVGQFLTSTLDAARRRVARSRNSAGYASIYSEAARAVLLEYPDLTAEQRRTVFGSLKHDAELTKVRTGLDSTVELGEVAMILGVTESESGIYYSPSETR